MLLFYAKVNSKFSPFSQLACDRNGSTHDIYLIFDLKQPNSPAIFIGMEPFAQLKKVFLMCFDVYSYSVVLSFYDEVSFAIPK